MSRLLAIFCIISGLILSNVAWSAEPPPELIEKARQQLQADEPQQAYETLDEYTGQYAGNEKFDYWLGLAAVRAGEYGRSTFALERVVANNPNHAGARMELATAYVALGQEEEAARQLAKLRTMDPPANAEERIAELEKAVARRTEREARQDELYYVSLEGGHDDNVGTYPGDFEIFPGFAPINPVDSAFYGARVGGSRNFQVKPDQKVGVTGQLYGKRHEKEDAEQFDQDFGLLRLRWLKDIDGRKEVDLGVEGATLRLDGEKYYNLAGAYGTWRNRVSETVTYDVTLRGRDLMFDAETNDYTFWSLGTSVEYQLAPRWRLDLGIAAELESANEDRAGGDAQITALDLGTRYALTSRHVFTGGLEYDYAVYQDDYAPGAAITNAQEEERTDNRTNLTLGWEWFFAEDWQTRLQGRYKEQESSLDLYTYDRTVGTFSITRFF